MTTTSNFNQPFSALNTQTAADEPYFHAGAHRLPQTGFDVPDTFQFDQDVDALQQLPSNGTSNDLSGLESPFEDIDLDIIYNGETGSWVSSPAATPAIPVAESFVQHGDFLPMLPRRTDSDLRATAPEFNPGQQWLQAPAQQWTTNTPSSQPRSLNRMQLMTPLRTTFAIDYATPPLSAPSQYGAYNYQPQPSTSPMISLTDDLYNTSYPQPAGYQWTGQVPPNQDINTWNSQGPRDFVDPARLTPVTPISPATASYTHSLARTASRTSRTSRTTNGGPYRCEHPACAEREPFNNKTDYTHHKRNHGQRQHQCTDCIKSFVFRKDLGRHQRTHTGERSMFGETVDGCTWCAKGFQRKDHYERHMKTHLKAGDALTPAGSCASRSRSGSCQ